MLHNPKPLALRLEAVIRILADPMPRIRRLASSLARTTRNRAVRAILPPVSKFVLLRENLLAAGERCSALLAAYFESG